MQVAVWALFLHATHAAEWIWIDQFCVPQDAPVEIKMAHVRESLDIYRTGKVRLWEKSDLTSWASNLLG